MEQLVKKMAKYYVQTGSHEVIVQADTVADAFRVAIKRILAKNPEKLGLLMSVSETGFESQNDEDTFMLVQTLLEELGLWVGPGVQECFENPDALDEFADELGSYGFMNPDSDVDIINDNEGEEWKNA